MTAPETDNQFSQTVDPAWTDSNGHLNVAYYALIFDRATDAFLDVLGIGESYAAITRHSTFVLECHTRFLAEVHAGETVLIKTQLIAADAKRIHYLHEMRVKGRTDLCATLEQLSIHVDLDSRRTTAWPETVQDRLNATATQNQRQPHPDLCGAISLAGKRK